MENFGELIEESIHKKLNEINFILDKNLNNFEKSTIGISTIRDCPRYYPREIISNEFIINIIKNLKSKFFENKIIDYIEFEDIENKFHDPKYGGVLLNKISNIRDTKNFKNIIVSAKIGAILQDSILFNFDIKNEYTVSNSSGIYKVGKILDLCVWIDPYIKFKDTFIIFFDEIHYNLDKCDVTKNITYKDVFSVKYQISATNSHVLFIINDKNDPNYGEYLKIKRDYRIEDILGN